MKATGIVRRIDDLGRVVIQKKSAVRYVFVKVIHWKFSWIVMEKLSLKNIRQLANLVILPKNMQNPCMRVQDM